MNSKGGEATFSWFNDVEAIGLFGLGELVRMDVGGNSVYEKYERVLFLAYFFVLQLLIFDSEKPH